MSDSISLLDLRALRSKGISTSLDKSKKKTRRISVESKNTDKSNKGPAKRSKYNAKKVLINGIEFDSKIEGQRYLFLLEQQKKGNINNLTLQEKFVLKIKDEVICTYLSDFSYTVLFDGSSASKVVEDVKGVKTPVYRLKKKLMKAILGIDIREVVSEGVTTL